MRKIAMVLPCPLDWQDPYYKPYNDWNRAVAWSATPHPDTIYIHPGPVALYHEQLSNPELLSVRVEAGVVNHPWILGRTLSWAKHPLRGVIASGLLAAQAVVAALNYHVPVVLFAHDWDIHRQVANDTESAVHFALVQADLVVFSSEEARDACTIPLKQSMVWPSGSDDSELRTRIHQVIP